MHRRRNVLGIKSSNRLSGPVKDVYSDGSFASVNLPISNVVVKVNTVLENGC